MSGTNGDGPRRLDLDARRAARAEAHQTSPGGVTVDGDFYPYAPELPLDFLDAFASATAKPGEGEAPGLAQVKAFAQLLTSILGADAYAELRTKHKLSLSDAEAIIEDAMEVYAVPFENSAPSPGSSTDTSTPSKPRSSRSTEPTSEPPSTETATV